MKIMTLYQFRKGLEKNIAMIKNYSEVEQMQNELQWWGEQKTLAFQEGDLKYMNECKENEEKLMQEISALLNLK